MLCCTTAAAAAGDTRSTLNLLYMVMKVLNQIPWSLTSTRNPSLVLTTALGASLRSNQYRQHQPQSSCISISNLKGGLRGGGLFQPSYLRFVSMIVECVLIHSPHSNLLNLISGQIMYGILNFALKDYKKEVGHKSNGLLQPIHHFDSDIILCAIISNDCF